ncbi:MAG: allantoate amidohydrolase [Rhizobiales bacterium PAR1]|nr:MAG: allantoate amidohydrolase [Rhizobiales bacterium PAR1]
MTKTVLSPAAIRQAVQAERARAERLFRQLAEGSPGHPGIMRDTYGPGENFAHHLIRAYAVEKGLGITTDAAENTYVTWPGQDRAAPRVLMGSHLDSVPNGGNFDGAAGVLAGLIVTAALRKLGVKPACDIVTMGVRAEESVWFQVSYIGSRSALGTLPEGALEARRVDTGRTLAEHMAECGAAPERIRAGERALDPASVRAFLEVHIEQAPALVELGVPMAICSGIPGNVRYPQARIVGKHGHVGTPMKFRADAAMAGADLAMRMDRLWRDHEIRGIPMAVTFGRFHTDSAAHGLTIVPGAFAFSVDIRAYDTSVLAGLEAHFHAAIREIEALRNVRFELGPRASAAVGPVDPAIAARLLTLAGEHEIPAISLGSPASHDSAAFAAAGVPMCMIFVRNENGSHNPDEAMEIDDFLEACTILASWVAEHVC